MLLACMLLCMTAQATDVDALKAGVFNPAREAPDFSIRGSDGVTLTLSHYRGKVVVLGFGYTSCPNVCPATLAVLAQAHRKLGALGAQVQVIYLTVDPERDSPERLKQYLAAFDPTFVGGTGTVAQMAAVRTRYGVTAEIAAVIAEGAFYDLDAPIKRMGAMHVPIPFSPPLEDATVPTEKSVFEVARKLCGRS